MTRAGTPSPSVRSGAATASVQVHLRPVAPFRLDLTAWALRRRPSNRIDVWEDGCYRRALVIDGHPVSVQATQTGRPTRPALAVTITGPRAALKPDRVEVARRAIERSLGLDADLQAFYGLAGADRHLAGLVDRFRGVKPPRFPTVFEALVNAVACQQLSLEVGIELLNRLTTAYGVVASGTDPPLTAFPEPEAVASALPMALRGLGFSTQKARSLVALGEAAAGGELDALGLDRLPRAEATTALLRLPGIGRWSAEYVLLRGVGRLDVYPGDDVGARNNLQRFLGLSSPPDYQAVNRLTARWSPFAGMVYFHMLLRGLADHGVVSPARASAKAWRKDRTVRHARPDARSRGERTPRAGRRSSRAR